MLKNKKGITLIALVVTIVVLLILVGVSISLVLDNNGIIGKSKESRLETRASQVEDEIGLWKQNNFIKSETGESIENANAVLQSLLARKLLNEEEIDRENEIITIKRNDGSILKQIEYGNVKINISKTPATEKSGVVTLKVESVEGLTIIKNEEELRNFINSLSENQKKEIIRNGYIKVVNKQDPSANCTTFQEALEWVKNQQWIDEATEDAFWTAVETSELGINGITGQILIEFYYNESTKMIEGYTITNPDNETSNRYIATENGTYTFKVQDILTGKIYTKEVEVTNIDKSLPLYTIVGEKDSHGYVYIMLKFEITDEYTNFEEAYIMYNNEKVEVTSEIRIDENNNTSYIETIMIDIVLYDKQISKRGSLGYTDQTIILVKDNKEYIGIVNMGNVEPS